MRTLQARSIASSEMIPEEFSPSPRRGMEWQSWRTLNSSRGGAPRAGSPGF